MRKVEFLKTIKVLGTGGEPLYSQGDIRRLPDDVAEKYVSMLAAVYMDDYPVNTEDGNSD